MENLYKKSDIPEDLAQYFEPAEIGLEETPEQYVSKMVEVFEQVRRVLKPEGTLWLNLGDSYYNRSQSGGGDPTIGQRNLGGRRQPPPKIIDGLKPKDLIGIPWMVAFALRSAGWYLRQDIIWHKPNPMPESVTDRCTKAHEYIFLMSKSQRYYYDHEAIKQPIAEASIERLSQDIESQEGSSRVPGKSNGNMKAVGRKEYTKDQAGGGSNITGHSGGYRSDGSPQEYLLTGKANKRSVWTVTTKPFKEFSETYHWRRVANDVVSYGTMHIVSPDCVVYGGLFDLLSMLLCGVHEADWENHKYSIYDYLVQEPKDGYAPIDHFLGVEIGGQNLGSFLLSYYPFAKESSSEIHKTDLFLSTSLSYTPSEERFYRIQHILTQHGLTALNPYNDDYNTWLDGFPCGQEPRTLYGMIDRLNAFSFGQRYKKITKKTDHFATFPEDLIVDCIKAGCPEGGIILDPFGGAGTTAVVARKLNRNYLLYELNPDYIKIAEKRIFNSLGIFA